MPLHFVYIIYKGNIWEGIRLERTGEIIQKRIIFWHKVVWALEELNLGYNDPSIDRAIEIIYMEIKRIKKGEE